METKQFIEDAIKGGWERERYYFDENGNWDYVDDLAFLDPAAWQAVGRIRGWRNIEEGTFEAEFTCWQAYFEGFFREIRDGKTIEEALTVIK